LGLEQVQLKPASFKVLPERFRGFRGYLGTLPEARVRVAKGLDLQVAKWQRMARDSTNQLDKVKSHSGVNPLHLIHFKLSHSKVYCITAR
jgi:hypothetical protein